MEEIKNKLSRWSISGALEWTIEKLRDNFFRDGRDKNLGKMILNLESNNDNDFRKNQDLYEIYSNMGELDYNDDFRKSLMNSSEYRTGCEMFELKKLEKNNPNSFMITSLIGYPHLWSALIRKTDEGFNVLMINKGLSFFNEPIKEYIFKESNIKNLVTSLEYATSITSSVQKAYENFEKRSNQTYSLKLNIAPQKVGNCFSKNIQAGIKVAYALSKMNAQEIRELRVKDYEPLEINEKEFKTLKWPNMNTKEANELFVDKLVEKNPAIKKHMGKYVEMYSMNKSFNDALKKGKDPLKSLFKSFDQENKTKDMSQDKRIKLLLENITYHTFAKNKAKITSIVKKSKDHEFIKAYEDLKNLTKKAVNSDRNFAYSLFVFNGLDCIESLKKIFDGDNKLKKLSDRKRVKILLNEISALKLIFHSSATKKLIEVAYGKEHVADRYVKLLENAVKKNMDECKSMPGDIVKSYKVAKYFPLVAPKVNPLSLGESNSRQLNL